MRLSRLILRLASAVGIMGGLASISLTPALAISTSVSTAPTASAEAPPVTFSRGVSDVLKMLDAKVDPDVIKAYIKNSTVPFNPTAAEIIALKQRDVPDDILTAMMERGAEIRAQIAQAAQSAPPVPAAPATTPYQYSAAAPYAYPYTYPYAYDYSDYPYGYPYYSYPYAYGYPYSYWWYNSYYPWGFYGFYSPFFFGGRFHDFDHFHDFHHGFHGNGSFAFHGHQGFGNHSAPWGAAAGAGFRGSFGRGGFGGRSFASMGARAGGFGGHMGGFAGHAGGFGGHGGGHR